MLKKIIPQKETTVVVDAPVDNDPVIKIEAESKIINTKPNYIIVKSGISSDVEKFQDLVNAKEDYKPLGGVAVTSNMSFFQAMVLKSGYYMGIDYATGDSIEERIQDEKV